MLVQTPLFIQEFIRDLDRISRSKVLGLLDILRSKDYQFVLCYSKKIDTDLFELKIHTAKNVRIFYTYYDANILILHIMIKKTWKIPLRDLETARKRLKLLRDL